MEPVAGQYCFALLQVLYIFVLNRTCLVTRDLGVHYLCTSSVKSKLKCLQVPSIDHLAL